MLRRRTLSGQISVVGASCHTTDRRIYIAITLELEISSRKDAASEHGTTTDFFLSVAIKFCSRRSVVVHVVGGEDEEEFTN